MEGREEVGDDVHLVYAFHLGVEEGRMCMSFAWAERGNIWRRTRRSSAPLFRHFCSARCLYTGLDMSPKKIISEMNKQTIDYPSI